MLRADDVLLKCVGTVSRKRHCADIALTCANGIVHRMIEVIRYFDHAEENVCVRINQFGRTAWIREFFAAVSRLGDGWFWGLMGIAIFALQGPSAWPQVLQMALTAGVGVAIYKAIKGRLVRERPYINSHAIVCGAAPLDRYSFPSGHTLHAVCFTVLIASIEPRLLPLAAAFAAAVATSRVVLGLHYPTDVLAGGTIGALIAVASLQLY